MNQNPWLDYAKELQFLAQCGLAYSTNEFDIERFERIRQIAAEMVACTCDLPIAKIKALFLNEKGYQTPKLDSRAVIFSGDKVLLVKEKNGKWALPGGWVDVNQSIASNTIKEAKEEAGLEVKPLRLIALEDSSKHNPHYLYNICRAFILCEALGGQFTPNNETVDSAYFPLDGLPPLAEGKTNREQLARCFAAKDNPHWQTVFD